MRQFATSLLFRDAERERPKDMELCVVVYVDKSGNIWWQRGYYFDGKWSVPSRKNEKVIAWAYLPLDYIRRFVKRARGEEE